MQVLPFIAILATAMSAELFDVHAVFFSKEDSFESVSASGQEVLVGSGSAMKLEWDEKGSSLRDPASQKFLHIGDDPKRLVTLDNEQQNRFSVQDGLLTFDGVAAFTSCEGELNFDNYEDGCEAVGITGLSKSEAKKQLELEARDDITDDDFDDFDDFDLEMRGDDDLEQEDRLEKRKKSKDVPGKNGKLFKIMAIRKGSRDMPIKKSKDQPHRLFVGGDQGLEVVLRFQGKYMVDQDGKGLALDGKMKTLGEVAPRKKAAENFKIRQNRLILGLSDEWYSCSIKNKQVLAKKRCKNGKRIALKVVMA